MPGSPDDRQPCPKCGALNCLADDTCVSCGYDLPPPDKRERRASGEAAAAVADPARSGQSHVETRSNGKVPPPAMERRARGAPFGWMSIVCACLSALLLLLVFLLLFLPVIVIPFGVQEPIWPNADHRFGWLEMVYVIALLWLAAIVLGILAVRRGDRRRGIAGLMLCGLEVALGVDLVCLGCVLITIAG